MPLTYEVGVENDAFKVERVGDRVRVTKKQPSRRSWVASTAEAASLIELMHLAVHRPEDVVKELHEGKVPAAWKGD